MVFSGLILAQSVATLQVYLSNIAFLDKLTALQKAGYLTIPNPPVMDALTRWGPAFFGGLFFTLTVGVAVTLAALFTAWMRIRFFPEGRAFPAVSAVLWAGILVWLNRNGWVPLASAYFVVIPPAVFFLARRRVQASAGGESGRRILLHLGCILILSALGADRINPGMFTRIRDHLLLTNPPGLAVNNFYYRYTLYPAQVFKSPSQDLIRTAFLDPNTGGSVADGLKKTLIRLDYPVIDSPNTADVVILQDGKNLKFLHKEEPILSITPAAFLESPRETLETFSRRVDRYGPFRRVTFWSLMAVSGLFVYFSLYLPGFFLAWLCGRCISLRLSKPVPVSAMAAVLCVGTGIGVLTAAVSTAPPALPPAALGTRLASPDPEDRIAALQYLHGRKIDIGPYGVHRKMAKSAHMPERYWLARALHHSRSRRTYDTNLDLLNDPQMNVAYMAYLALGRRGDRRAVAEILVRLKSEDRWYVQLYAYKALRRLGWRQTGSS